MDSDYYSSSDDDFIDDEENEKLLDLSKVPEFVQQWCRYQEKQHGSHDDKSRAKINFVLDYPWFTINQMPVSLNSTRKEMNQFWTQTKKRIRANISYMDQVCEELLTQVAKMITNPESRKRPILLVGPPGVGKTKILNKVFGPVLNTPVEYINVSGYTREDLSTLKGSGGVFVGSGPSSLIQAIHRAKALNPVIVFDEFDKILDIQIYHWFNQLFDDSSTTFMDMFIEGLPFDISRLTFVCIANSTEMIPEPLMNRFKKIIHIQAPTNEQKVDIVLKHTIPEILKAYNFGLSDIVFTRHIIRFMIKKHNIKKNEGLRNLNSLIESVVEKLNLMRTMHKNIFNTSWHSKITFPVNLTEKMIDELT